MALSSLLMDLCQPNTDRGRLASVSSTERWAPVLEGGLLMVREDAESKAKRYLSEGRIIIVRVSDDRLLARVRGDGSVWLVMFEGGVWSCPCPARTDQCSHLRAVRLVTAVEVDR